MKRVRIIQTGGTISMKPDPFNPAHVTGDAEAAAELIKKQIPELKELADIRVLPLLYMDSSNLGPDQWQYLAETIKTEYHQFDGFVVLHGTDTMAWTASALSFALQGLGKPVIFTGSQVPLAMLRSDARRNLINAVELATLAIPEVGICFNDHLFRGNRSSKMSIGDFDAFNSPNFPPLAEIGLHIKLGRDLSGETGPLADVTGFDRSVHILKVFPGMQAERHAPLVSSGLKCLFIEAFGSGNFPIEGPHSLLPFFKDCRDAGIIMVMTSQAPYDAVDLAKYEAGRAARELGVVSAGDMTLEASVTKMMWLLHRYDNRDTILQEFSQPLAGEMSI